MARQAPAAPDVPPAGDERRSIEAAQRDPRHFAELYEQNFDRVYAFIARRARDREEAEDLTAEVFHHALANLSRFEWRGIPFVVWLLRIARNTMADRWARSSREASDPAAEVDAGAVPAEVERRAILAELVGRLPNDQQRVIVERFVEQKSVHEIAQALRRTDGAVKQLQFRALESLRAHMRDVP